MALEYSIRLLQPEDAMQYFELNQMIGKVDWNSTQGHLRDIIKAYDGYVRGAFLPDGKLICACVGHPMGEDVGYIGTFITHPDYRKKGVGRKVWFKCMEILGDRNIFIIATPNMIPVYKKWGFQTPTTHGMAFGEGIPKFPTNCQSPENLIVQNVSESNFDDVMAFDKTVSLVDRRDVMKVFFDSEHTKILKCAVDTANQVVGYIMLRNGLKGLRMSAFYANTQEIAKVLLIEAFKDVEPDTTIEIGFSVANLEQCKPVYELVGFENFKIGSMGLCTKQDVALPWHKVFGVLECFYMFY